MADIQSIIASEQDNLHHINLYREGVFLTAYEQSCYAFIINQVRGRIMHNLHLLREDLQQQTGQHISSVMNSYIGLLGHYRTWFIRCQEFSHPTWCHAGLFNTPLTRFVCYNRWWQNPPYALRLID